MEIKVKDMHCKNCAAKVEKALLMNGVRPKIDLDNHIVLVKDNDVTKAVEVIKQTGYTPTV